MLMLSKIIVIFIANDLDEILAKNEKTVLINPAMVQGSRLNELFKKYFNVNDINEIEKIANSKYIKPLAILRYITAYLRDDIDNSSKKEYAKSLLINELIPFINKNI